LRSTLRLALSIPLYWSFRRLARPTLLPINYTFSVSYRCNSRCITCDIWRIQYRVPKKLELTLDEWERVIKSLGSSPYWITVSGGEPFLRRDLVDLVRTIDEYNKPKIINIPTNAISTDKFYLSLLGWSLAMIHVIDVLLDLFTLGIT
jgi:molybdenum cofactor biosynthesis enzyme MoaA